MWSNNKNIDSIINCLLFLLAINFLHLGQFALPIICLIIFVDNKFKFKVKNNINFIIILLFGISFLLFSYKLGFYSTMGLCLPMAYYIGSNIKQKSENSIKKLIYIFAFGMALHAILNMFADFLIAGVNSIGSSRHYDIWTGEKVPTTTTAVNFVFVIALSYYIILHETNKKYRYIGIFLFSSILIYDIALGRRTPLFMLVLCVLFSVAFEYLFIGNKKVLNKEVIIYFSLFVLFTIVTVFILYRYDILGFKEIALSLNIVKKFIEHGLDPGRFEIFVNAIKLMPEHLWGGQEIFSILGIQIHDLWMDTYDYAGIIPFVLLTAHSLIFLVDFIKIIKNKHISNDFKLFISSLFFAITIQLFLEPVMTGSSLFIIIVIIIEASLEKAFVYGKKHIK